VTRAGDASPLPIGVVVTCEHASRAVPPALRGLGLPSAVLASHRGWDPGAAPIATALAAALRAPLHLGEWSRLVVDLNRSEHQPGVIARRVDGRVVPGNQVDAGARASRLAQYWLPWRARAQADIAAAAARGVALHLSVHSFTPRLHGKVRANDIGLLHDPARAREVAACAALRPVLVAHGLSMRRNFPYFGTSDGFTTWLRARLPPRRYVGIEIECNQRLVTTRAGQRRAAAALVEALRTLLPVG
jgi:predicted N-formylglutamate amidohydrolase